MSPREILFFSTAFSMSVVQAGRRINAATACRLVLGVNWFQVSSNALLVLEARLSLNAVMNPFARAGGLKVETWRRINSTVSLLLSIPVNRFAAATRFSSGAPASDIWFFRDSTIAATFAPKRSG